MVMKRLVIALWVSVVLSALIVAPAVTGYAQGPAEKIPVSHGPVQQINPHFSKQDITYDDGTVIERSVINGPPKPPPGYAKRTTVLLPEPMPEMGVNTLSVPAFRWVFGCSAVSASMIAGYYDQQGFPAIYTGLTNGGVIQSMEDSSWGSWTDSAGDTYPNNPLIASHQGLEGRGLVGSIDDYWISYLSDDDPYLIGHWAQHTWGDAVGDYMKTSQSAYNNVDGSTTFYLNNSAIPLTCNAMQLYGIADEDGTYGRKLFYEAREYTVTDCYTQMTDNKQRGGFSFAKYKAEIDAGRPVLLNLEGHSIVGVGYDDSMNTVYIHDTWDNSTHTMTWGGSYSGMKLWGVSIVNLQASTANTPDISVTPGSYDFGNVNISNTSTQTFTVSNTGTANLMLETITINGSSDFSLNATNCSNKTIGPSSSCTVQVTFSPASVGDKSATMSIPSNDLDKNPLNISLTGTGVTAVQPDLTGTWSNVSWTGSRKGVYTVSGTFTTRNNGSATANNVVVKFYYSDDETYNSGYVLTTTTNIKTLSPGSSKVTSIKYSPKSSPSGKYLIAVIDPSNSITESNEGNNEIAAIIPTP
jgi:YD repeat-containing protein